MKNILITGANSYIGKSFEKYASRFGEKYHFDTLDMMDPLWSEKSFVGYDCIFHVAGIAHQKETRKNADIYYSVNRDLAIKVAEKAKEDKVSQFIFLSSMSVYGIQHGVVTKDTKLVPNTNYGKSKLQAERELKNFASENFKVAIVRPPMIYGKGCKGNYCSLSKLAKKTPIFPDVKNQRSMLYIDNLCEFVKNLIDIEAYGLFLPQNKDFVNTTDMVKQIAKVNGKKIRTTPIFNFLLPIGRLITSTVDKVFGSLVYDKELSTYGFEYSLIDFEDSIRLTESK